MPATAAPEKYDGRDIKLLFGGHPGRFDAAGNPTMCVMEFAAWVAGERHSDTPSCASPVLRRFLIAFNDRLPDADRQKLVPYGIKVVGTAGDGKDAERLRLCREFLVRTSLPKWLDRAGLQDAATKIRELPGPLTEEATRKAIYEARDAAWDARRAARKRLYNKVYEKVRAATDATDAAAATDAADATSARWEAVYRRVYEAVRAKYDDLLKPLADEARADAFGLLDELVSI